MDSDCLIKLTKGRAKGKVLMHNKVVIPQIVKIETVDEGKACSYPDSLEIEKNIKKGKIVVKPNHISSEIRHVAETLRLKGGEVYVYSIFKNGGFTAIASDDQKFIKKMTEINIPCITPTALIIYTWRTGGMDKEKASQLLENIKPMVSDQEYILSRLEIEKGGESL